VTLRTECEKTARRWINWCSIWPRARPAVWEDKVYVEGTGQFGPQPQVQLKTRIESLTLEPYLVLLGARRA